MRPEEYLLANRVIHIEMERLAGRIMELARFGCADPSNHVFLSLMERQSELLDQLAELNDKATLEFAASSRSPLA
jgi:hypothetical protein